MVVVDYVSPVEFRSPPRYGILVPYLMLFFGSILLMGIPMFRFESRVVAGDGREHGSPVELDAGRDAQGSRLTTDGHSACHRAAARLITQPAASSRPPEGRIAEGRVRRT